MRGRTTGTPAFYSVGPQLDPSMCGRKTSQCHGGRFTPDRRMGLVYPPKASALEREWSPLARLHPRLWVKRAGARAVVESRPVSLPCHSGHASWPGKIFLKGRAAGCHYSLVTCGKSGIQSFPRAPHSGGQSEVWPWQANRHVKPGFLVVGGCYAKFARCDAAGAQPAELLASDAVDSSSRWRVAI